MTAPQLSPKEKPRLAGQRRRIMALYLSRPGWYTLGEIVRAIGGTSEAGCSMRLRELTYAPHYWRKTIRIRSGNLREYKLVPPGAPTQLDLLP